MRRDTQSNLAATPAGPGSPLPPSVNWHLWRACNMACRFCFATFGDTVGVLPRGHLDSRSAARLNGMLAESFRKVTYVGGEPTLCPWLDRLLLEAKGRGTTTLVVSNGSLLTRDRLEAWKGIVDWLGLSVDTAYPASHVATGRAVRGVPLPAEHYVAVAATARRLGIRLKVNTVVTAANVRDDMTALLRQLRPERWKLFQMLPVRGQNDAGASALQVSAEAFHTFVGRHARLGEEGIAVVPEDNGAMTGSYAMVDPAGRFFDNVDGEYAYGPPILGSGVGTAWAAVRFGFSGFLARGGDYDWDKTLMTSAP